MTYILVLISLVFRGQEIQIIPGYQTKELCETAGKQFGSPWGDDGQQHSTLSFKCIDGPVVQAKEPVIQGPAVQEPVVQGKKGDVCKSLKRK